MRHTALPATPPSSTSTFARACSVAALSLSLGAGFLSPASAHAQGAATPATPAPSPQEVAKATAAFQEGLRSFQAKKYGIALDAFQRSYDTVKSPNSLLYVARCQAELGKAKEAFRVYTRVIDEADERAVAEPKYAPTRDTAKFELGELSAKLALLSIEVVNATPDTRMRIQGGIVAREEWGKPMPFDAGPVQVTVDTPGQAPIERTVELSVGMNERLEIDAVPPPPVEEKREEPKAEVRIDGGGGSLLPYAIVAGGIGVVGMGVFAIAGSMSNSTFDELQSACGGPCPSSQNDVIDRGQTEQTIANVGLIVGAVGLAAGAALLVVDLTSGDGADSTAKGPSPLALDVGPGWVGVHGHF